MGTVFREQEQQQVQEQVQVSDTGSVIGFRPSRIGDSPRRGSSIAPAFQAVTLLAPNAAAVRLAIRFPLFWVIIR